MHATKRFGVNHCEGTKAEEVSNKTTSDYVRSLLGENYVDLDSVEKNIINGVRRKLFNGKGFITFTGLELALENADDEIEFPKNIMLIDSSFTKGKIKFWSGDVTSAAPGAVVVSLSQNANAITGCPGSIIVPEHDGKCTSKSVGGLVLLESDTFRWHGDYTTASVVYDFSKMNPWNEQVANHFCLLEDQGPILFERCVLKDIHFYENLPFAPYIQDFPCELRSRMYDELIGAYQSAGEKYSQGDEGIEKNEALAEQCFVQANELKNLLVN